MVLPIIRASGVDLQIRASSLRDRRLAVFLEQIVEGLGQEVLLSGVAVERGLLELLDALGRIVAHEWLLPCPARLRKSGGLPGGALADRCGWRFRGGLRGHIGDAA